MRIVSQGRLFALPVGSTWMASHAQTPLLHDLGDGRAIIYFATRDEKNRTRTAMIETRLDDLQQLAPVYGTPVLDLGEPGMFDDSGAMPSWLVERDGCLWLYYTGWNVGTTVPYRNSIGVAEFDQRSQTFTKLFPGPLLDRTPLEPYFCATPCVIFHNGYWHMWYLSCTEWRPYKDHMEPFYDIKYARSDDGVNWERNGTVAIALSGDEEAGLARPSVLIEDGRYRMWYSYRGYRDHRESALTSYKIGYAESEDGQHWTRLDDTVEFVASGEAWDDTMQAYPFVFRRNDELLMLYNGNGFGASGFGVASIDA